MRAYATFILILLLVSTAFVVKGQKANKYKRYLFLEKDELLDTNNIMAIPGIARLNTHYSKKEIHSILNYLIQSKSKVEMSDSLRAIILNRVGCCEIAFNSDWNSAIHNFEQSNSYALSSQKKLLINNYRELTTGYKRIGDYQKAIASTKELINLFQPNFTIIDSTDTKYAYGHLSKLYILMEKTDSSKIYQNLYDSYKIDPLQIWKNVESKSYKHYQEALENRVDFQKLKINLEKEKSHQLNIQKRKQRNLWIALCSLLFLFVLLFWIKNSRDKKILKIKNLEQEAEIDLLLSRGQDELIQDMLLIQEKERSRIAKELHDRIGGMLAMAKVHFKITEDKLKISNQEDLHQLKIGNDLLDQACDETRSISHDLSNGKIAKFGLIYAIGELVDIVKSMAKYDIEFIHHGWGFPISQSIELSLYRIIQELLSNILKHAYAKNISIQLIKRNDILNLIVEDDGNGFSLEEAQLGIGIKNIEKRTKEMKGQLNVDSHKIQGTCISISIDLIHLKPQDA